MRQGKTGERIKFEHKKVKKNVWENKKRNGTERKRKWDGRRTEEKPIRGKWEELRDEGLPDGRRLLPRKHREGRTMGIWSGVSHPIIIRPCHLETERRSYSQQIAETDNLLQAAPQNNEFWSTCQMRDELMDQQTKNHVLYHHITRLNVLQNLCSCHCSSFSIAFTLSPCLLHINSTLHEVCTHSILTLSYEMWSTMLSLRQITTDGSGPTLSQTRTLYGVGSQRFKPRKGKCLSNIYLNNLSAPYYTNMLRRPIKIWALRNITFLFNFYHYNI